MAVLMRASGKTEDVTPASGKAWFTVQELQDYVGGYFEVIHLTNNTILVCNEYGKTEALPVNAAATMYCRLNGLSDLILGDVLIAAMKEVR
jgi:hypothetical protein